MTSKLVFEAVLMELNKQNAPSIDLETFNYFFNKAINQFVNKLYNVGVDTDLQRTDDIRVLKSSAILKPIKTPKNLSKLITDILGTEDTNGEKESAEVINTDSIYGATYEFNLPADYLHLLNCICLYKVRKKINCPYNVGDIVRKGATKCSADTWPLIIDNLYMRPTYKRPYYYINNLNTNEQLPTNPVNISDTYKDLSIPFEGTDYAYTSSPKIEQSTVTKKFTNGKIFVANDTFVTDLKTAFDNGLVMKTADKELSSTSNSVPDKLTGYLFMSTTLSRYGNISLDASKFDFSTCGTILTEYVKSQISTLAVLSLPEICKAWTSTSPVRIDFNKAGEISSLLIPSDATGVLTLYDSVAYDKNLKLAGTSLEGKIYTDCTLEVKDGLLKEALDIVKADKVFIINNEEQYNKFIDIANKLNTTFPDLFDIIKPKVSLEHDSITSPILTKAPTEGTPSYNKDVNGNYISLKTNSYGGALVDNPNFPRYINVNGIKESNVVKFAGHRYGNASSVRLEIRYGQDSSVFELIGVMIDYIKTPQFIRLTQELMDLTEDTSQILEFPEYICQEIINELTKIIMENSSDPRLQTNPVINLSIAAPAQALTPVKK